MHSNARSHHQSTVDAFFTSGFEGVAAGRAAELRAATLRGVMDTGSPQRVGRAMAARIRLGQVVVRAGNRIAGTATLPPVAIDLVPSEMNAR